MNWLLAKALFLLSAEHVNEKGVQYYDYLINHLLENNITPIVTLYHWDLPQVNETIWIQLLLARQHKRLNGLRCCFVLLSFLIVFHFKVLQEKYGGWQNISMVNYFNEYANLCFERFGNRVKYWITFNNPWVCLELGSKYLQLNNYYHLSP